MRIFQPYSSCLGASIGRELIPRYGFCGRDKYGMLHVFNVAYGNSVISTHMKLHGKNYSTFQCHAYVSRYGTRV